MGPFLSSSLSPVETLPESGGWKPEHSATSCDQKQSTNLWFKSWPEAVEGIQLNLFSHFLVPNCLSPCIEGDHLSWSAWDSLSLHLCPSIIALPFSLIVVPVKTMDHKLHEVFI